jgi:hypothetical protein
VLQLILLLAEGRANLLVGGESDFRFSESGVCQFAIVTQLVEAVVELGDLGLQRGFMLLELANAGGERVAFLVAFVLLRGEAFQLVGDRLGFLIEGADGALQRIELALARGDGHFLRAQICPGLFEAGLKFRLLALQCALAATGFVHLLLQLSERTLQFRDLVFAGKHGALRLGIAACAAGEDSLPREDFAGTSHEVEITCGFLPSSGCGGEIGGDAGSLQQLAKERLNRFVRLDHAENGSGAGRKKLGELGLSGAGEIECGDARPALLLGGEFCDDLLCGFRLLDEHQLEVMAEGSFDCGDVFVRNANLISKGTDHALVALENGLGASAEAFVIMLQLLEQVQAGAFFGLLAQQLIEHLAGFAQLLLDLAQACLAFLESATAGLDVDLLRLEICLEFLQARFQSRFFLAELNLLRGEFFHPHQIALLLQIDLVDFVA